MIQNEFQAHSDEITCITIVESLSCFITSSKDKFVKIFNYNCECLGVINSLPKLAKYEGEMPKWTFHIDEKKILEDEINEVVGIFEKVGVEMIKTGSKTDKEVENIQIIEKSENVKNKNKDDIVDKSKKKFKKIEKVEKWKKNKDEEENKVVLTYEGFYVQEAEKNIESIINVDVPNLGINEITSKVIGTVIDNNKKNKTMKILEKKKADENRRSETRKFSTKTIKYYPLKKIKSGQIEQHNKIPKLNINYINNTENNQPTTIATISQKTFKESIPEKEEDKTLKEDIIKTQTIKNVSIPKSNISNLETIKDMFHNKIKRQRLKSHNKIKFRNDLYSETLFSRTYRTNKDVGQLTHTSGFKTGRISKKINSSNLPSLGNKIIFSKGETEKLLNYHFYSTSYRACCQTSQYNNIPNSSMKANYRNNWRMVRNYVNEKKEQEIRRQNKKEKLEMIKKTEK